MYDRGTVVRGSRGGIAGGNDGLQCVVELELFWQGAETELTTDLGGLETLAVVGELQPVDFALLVLHTLNRDTISVEFVEEHGVARQAFPSVFVQYGVADVSNLLLCPLSCGISLGFSIRSRGADFVDNGQSVLATEFFDNSGCSIANEGGIVDLSAEADSIGDDVHVVDVFCGAYSMVWADENGCDYGPLHRPAGVGEQAQFVGTN